MTNIKDKLSSLNKEILKDFLENLVKRFDILTKWMICPILDISVIKNGKWY